jgi:Flp pilus assembly CpaE family ATPase
METRGRIAVVIGSTPNIGTTVVTMGAAVQLARRTDHSIGVICLNLKSSKLHRYMGLDNAPAGLDGLRADMKGGSLDQYRLLRSAEPVKGLPRLRILYGSQQREQAEFYQPEDIRHLLEAARAAFDVCLVEVNAYWDNAATVTAVLEADERLLVTTTELGSFQEDLDRGLKTMAPLLGMDTGSFRLVVNQEGGSGTSGLRAADVRREAGMELAAVIGYDPGLRDQLNQGRLLDYVQTSRTFVQPLDTLSGGWMGRWSLRAAPETAPLPGIRRWIPSFTGR